MDKLIAKITVLAKLGVSIEFRPVDDDILKIIFTDFRPDHENRHSFDVTYELLEQAMPTTVNFFICETIDDYIKNTYVHG